METDPRHNMLLEQMDTRLHIPSFYKGGGVAFGISAVLLGIAGGLYLEWTLEPDSLDAVGESMEWRMMSADGLPKDWRVCSLEMFTDRYCEEPIDLKTATAFSSSAVPAGFEDNTCDSVWASRTDSAKQYIGWSFAAPVEVGCMKVQPFRNVTSCLNAFCTDPGSCELGVQCDTFCCLRRTSTYNVDLVHLQAKRDNIFRTVATVSYDGDARSPELKTSASYPKDNDMKIYMLVAWIIVLVFGLSGLLLVTPSVLCSISSLRTKMTTMQAQVDAREACICNASDAQWFEFVEEQWGPNGAVRKAQNGPILTLLIGICVGGLGTAFLKFRTFIRGDDIPWVWCAIIMIPVGIIVVFSAWFGEKIVRRRRYAKCKRAKFPVILAPESLYFGGVFVHGKQGCTSNCRVTLTRFVRNTPGAGCCVEVMYVVAGKNDTTKKVTAPIGEECLAAAKAYVLQHRAFYKVRVNATPNSVEIGEI